MTRVALAALAAGLVLMGAAVAQDASAPSTPGADDSRFSFHRVLDSFVRLDGRTGQVSVCGRETSGWACRAVPDERAALEEAIGRLQGDNAALKKDLLARGLPLPSGVKPEPPARQGARQAGRGEPGSEVAQRCRARSRHGLHREGLEAAGRDDGRFPARHAAQELNGGAPCLAAYQRSRARRPS